MLEKLVDGPKSKFIGVSNLAKYGYPAGCGDPAHSVPQSGSALRGAPTAR